MKFSVAKAASRLSAATLVAVTLAVVAAAISVDVRKSQITATFRQMNVPVEGRFMIFRGSIDFDPKNAAAGKARIEVDTASFDVGAAEYNEQLHGQEWFDTPTYPKASFVSSHVAPAGPNRFEVRGRFTLKDKTQKIKVAFTQRFEGGVQVYEGEFPLSRKMYSIGSADWDETLEDKVIVKFKITTAAK